jgi:hypothetical protein
MHDAANCSVQCASPIFHLLRYEGRYCTEMGGKMEMAREMGIKDAHCVNASIGDAERICGTNNRPVSILQIFWFCSPNIPYFLIGCSVSIIRIGEPSNFCTDPDLTSFFIDFKDAKQNFFSSYFSLYIICPQAPHL